MKITKRRRSRQLALQVLYACEFTQEPHHAALQSILADHTYPNDIVPFSMELLSKVEEHRNMLDELISDASFNWNIKRFALIDKLILRIALAEICFFEAIPYKVSIDEAIEISKTFSTEDSGKFINGILDAIGRKLNKK